MTARPGVDALGSYCCPAYEDAMAAFDEAAYYAAKDDDSDDDSDQP